MIDIIFLYINLYNLSIGYSTKSPGTYFQLSKITCFKCCSTALLTWILVQRFNIYIDTQQEVKDRKLKIHRRLMTECKRLCSPLAASYLPFRCHKQIL